MNWAELHWGVLRAEDVRAVRAAFQPADAVGAALEMLVQPILLTLAERVGKSPAREFQSTRVIVAAHNCSSANAGFNAARPR